MCAVCIISFYNQIHVAREPDSHKYSITVTSGPRNPLLYAIPMFYTFKSNNCIDQTILDPDQTFCC